MWLAIVAMCFTGEGGTFCRAVSTLKPVEIQALCLIEGHEYLDDQISRLDPDYDVEVTLAEVVCLPIGREL